MLVEKQPLLSKAKNNHTAAQPYLWSNIVTRFNDFIFKQTFDIYKTCEKGDFAGLKRFIDAYSDKQELKKVLNQQDHIYGFSPLYFAVENKHLDCAQLLLENGANVNFKPLGPSNSVLHLAAIYADAPMIALLLQYDPKLDIKNARKRKPEDINPALFAEAKKILKQQGAEGYVALSTSKKEL